MNQPRPPRALVVTALTAALLCLPPTAGATGPPTSCHTLRDGQSYIDWARARSGLNYSAPNRQPQSLRTLLHADPPTDGQGYIEWARARSGQNYVAPNRPTRPATRPQRQTR